MKLGPALNDRTASSPQTPYSTHRGPDSCKLHYGIACLLSGKYQVENLSILWEQENHSVYTWTRSTGH